MVEVFQSVNDLHEYVLAGVKWDRVWTVPQIGIDTKIDGFDQQKFLDKTSKGGTMGDIWDLSAEMSSKRADKLGGIDPLKAAEDKKYSDARGGKTRAQVAKPSRDIIIG